MKNTIFVVAVGVGLSACGGESDSVKVPVSNAPSTATLDIGAATDASLNTGQATVAVSTPTIDEVPPAVATDSQSLSVSSTFSFNTARTVDVDFDLEQARNQVASVSVCTSFEPEGGAFGVDYDSCTVQGRMVDGVFHHSMEVTNDIESVAGVVWFQDSAMQPLMQVFNVAHDTDLASKNRSSLSLSQGPKIVWR